MGVGLWIKIEKRDLSFTIVGRQHTDWGRPITPITCNSRSTNITILEKAFAKPSSSTLTGNFRLLVREYCPTVWK